VCCVDGYYNTPRKLGIVKPVVLVDLLLCLHKCTTPFILCPTGYVKSCSPTTVETSSLYPRNVLRGYEYFHITSVINESSQERKS
jgi:hypothetical protein